MLGHVGQRFAGGVRDGGRDPGRDDGRALAVDVDVDAEPAAAHGGDNGPHLTGQVAGRTPGVGGRIALVAERVLDQGDILSAAADHHGRVFGAGPRQRGERVEDGVVQQALVLAAFDVPGQDGVLFAGGVSGRVQGGVGRLGPAVELPSGKGVHEPDHDQDHRRPRQRPQVADRPYGRAEPVSRRGNQRQQHGQRAGRVPPRE